MRVQGTLYSGNGFPRALLAHAVELLEEPPSGAHPAAEGVMDTSEWLMDQRLGSQHESAQHAYPVTQQAAIRWMVDRGLHTGAIDPVLAGAGDLRLLGQLRGAVYQRLQRFQSERLRPAQHGRLVGHLLEIDAAEPTQHQRIGDACDGLGVTPGIQVLHNEQAQEHLGRRGVAAMDQRQLVALCQVGAHLLVETIVVEEAVQRDEHGVRLVGQLGHTGEDIRGWVTVDEHNDASSLSAVNSAFYRQLRGRIRAFSRLSGPKSHR